MPSKSNIIYVPELGNGPSIQSIISSNARRRLSLSGARGGSLAPFLVQYQRHQQEPMVVITQDPTAAQRLWSDLGHHLSAELGETGDAVLHYPPFDTSPYSEMVPQRQQAMERAAVLFRLLFDEAWRFLVVSVQSLIRKVVPKETFTAGCLAVRTGVPANRQALIGALEVGRYYRTSLVEEPGTFAARGSLVDVFPPYLSTPVRIDFFGSEIDNLRHFDPETQSSAQTVNHVWIHPCQPLFQSPHQDDRNKTAARIRACCDRVNQPTSKTTILIEDILTDRPILGMDRFFPGFYDQPGSLLDYLPSRVRFCLDGTEGIDGALRKALYGLGREYEAHIERGEPAFPPTAHCIESCQLEAALDEATVVAVTELNVLADEVDTEGLEGAIDLKADGTDTLVERLQTQLGQEKSLEMVTYFAKYLKKLISQGYRVAVVTHTPGQASRLAKMLGARKIASSEARTPNHLKQPGLAITHGDLTRGCILPGDGVAWIAEEEVFGRRSRRSAKSVSRSKAALSDLKSLQPGDLVVHEEHGIGKYEGLVTQQIRSAPVDFLLITYRDGDKLYLPVYRLSQVQKYRGGGPDQRLDKLGGQTFSKAVAKAKKASEEMAAKLLALYAERSVAKRAPFSTDEEMLRSFEAAFPFEETEDQTKAIDETMADLDSETPMDRLVCGDVGFGKTEIAMRAAFRAALGGVQTAVLVPTTVLAQQHYHSFLARFGPYPVHVDMLSRFRTAKQNRATVLAVKEGRTDIVIGTHRLLSKDVHFKKLGLLIIDEEHRFGVRHKERIRTLRASVDTLVLTATPIPRTLQMAFAGIRSLSLIATAPAARRPIKTMICHDDASIIQKAITAELDRNGQVFFVHNRVRSIHGVAERLAALVPGARIAVGHGQMPESALEKVMLEFVAGRFDILVCTAIIESGLDIPRANTIIIDRADTFGMAQLYQIRGRVGRSSRQAYAYLIVPPLSALSSDARERVETLTRHTDLGSGFSIATMDLELRGAGNLIGPEQSGNVAAVGLEMFCDLLQKAASKLKGELTVDHVEPELTLERPGLLPETYIPDVGQRLQLYKELASAPDEHSVERIAADIVDRFGPLPEETEALVAGMVAKSICRRLRISGLEVSSGALSLHLTPDTALSPESIVAAVRASAGTTRLTPALSVKHRFAPDDTGGIKSAIQFLHRLDAYDNNLSIS